MALALACVPGTQAQVTNLTNGSTINFSDLGTGEFSVLVGDKLFSDFSLNNYNASNVTVKGIEQGGDYGIQFGTGFVDMNGVMDFQLSYVVSVTNSDNLISGANLSFNGVVIGTNGGLAEVTEQIQTNNEVGVYGTMYVEVTPQMQLYSTNMVINPPQPALSVDKDVVEYAVDLTYASISTIDQTFAQVPEPSTMVLAAAGLAGLLLLRRRRH